MRDARDGNVHSALRCGNKGGYEAVTDGKWKWSCSYVKHSGTILSGPLHQMSTKSQHTTHTHGGEKPFTINDSFTAVNHGRFAGIVGKNVPFIYINDNSKVLARRIVLYVSCILHSLLCKRASAKQVEFAVSKLLSRADFFPLLAIK